MAERPPILVVDDEPQACQTLARLLDEEFVTHTATDTASARAVLESEPVQVVLCDQRMPDMAGVDFLQEVRERWPDAVRMIISAYTDSEDIIAGVNQAGIYQYITKPWNPDNLLLTVRGAARLYQLQQDNERLSRELKLAPGQVQGRVEDKRERVQEAYELDRVVRCPDSRLNPVCDQVLRVAPYNITVLLTGESGTGKELFARAIHYNSPRAQAPFLAENCGPGLLDERVPRVHQNRTGALLERTFELHRAQEGPGPNGSFVIPRVSGAQLDVQDRRDAPRVLGAESARVEIGARHQVAREGRIKPDDVERFVNRDAIHEHEVLRGCATPYVEASAPVSRRRYAREPS